LTFAVGGYGPVSISVDQREQYLVFVFLVFVVRDICFVSGVSKQ